MSPQATALKHIAKLRWTNENGLLLRSQGKALLDFAQGIADLECRHCDAGVIRSVKSDRFYVGGREILVEDCPDCASVRAALDRFNVEMGGRL